MLSNPLGQIDHLADGSHLACVSRELRQGAVARAPFIQEGEKAGDGKGGRDTCRTAQKPLFTGQSGCRQQPERREALTGPRSKQIIEKRQKDERRRGGGRTVGGVKPRLITLSFCGCLKGRRGKEIKTNGMRCKTEEM